MPKTLQMRCHVQVVVVFSKELIQPEHTVRTLGPTMAWQRHISLRAVEDPPTNPPSMVSTATGALETSHVGRSITPRRRPPPVGYYPLEQRAGGNLPSQPDCLDPAHRRSLTFVGPAHEFLNPRPAPIPPQHQLRQVQSSSLRLPAVPTRAVTRRYSDVTGFSSAIPQVPRTPIEQPASSTTPSSQVHVVGGAVTNDGPDSTVPAGNSGVPHPWITERSYWETNEPSQSNRFWGGLRSIQCDTVLFLVCFNAFGFPFAYGTFLIHYLSSMPEVSLVKLAFISSVQLGLAAAGGLLQFQIKKIRTVRGILVLGSVVFTAAVFLLERCTEWWHLLLAQGIMAGIGSSLMFAAVLQYYDHRPYQRNAADVSRSSLPIVRGQFTSRTRTSDVKDGLGRALSLGPLGLSAGMLVYSVAFQQLQLSVAWPWTSRASGCIAFITLLTANLTMTRHKHDFALVPKLPLRVASKTVVFLYGAGIFFEVLGIIPPVIFVVQEYATLSPNDTKTALALVPIMAGSSLALCTLYRLLASNWSHAFLQSMLQSALAIAAVILFFWIGLGFSSAGLVVFAIAYGAALAGLLLIPRLIWSTIRCHGEKVSPPQCVALFAAASIACLVSTLVFAAIVDATGQYTGGKILCGGSLLIGFGLFYVAGKPGTQGVAPSSRL